MAVLYAHVQHFATRVSWTQARNRCIAAGGDLASIHSAQQNAAVAALKV
eukprot:COSAG01_NODE_66338_length_270_cov_0.912281_1_plen_48_part_10